MTAVAGTQSDLSAWAKDLERFLTGGPKTLGFLLKLEKFLPAMGRRAANDP